MAPLDSIKHIFQQIQSKRPSRPRISSFAASAARPLIWGLQGLLDFLVVDACCACGKGPRSRSASYPECPPPADYMLARTTVSLFGVVPVENHPICRDCAALFEAADGASLVGWYDQRGRVRALTGDVFEPAGTDKPVDETPNKDKPSARRIPLWVVAPFKMNDMSLKTIHLIKFSGRRSLVPLTAGAVGHALRTQITPRRRDAVLVAVPMDPASQRRRGFNQAELIAQALANATGLPTLSDVLRKVRRTPPQSLTGRRNRGQNVRGAFASGAGDISGKSVLLVDDLVTTGATVSACTSVLVAAGARSVTAVCLAAAL